MRTRNPGLFFQVARSLHGVSRIEKTLRTFHCHQRVLLNAKISQMFEVTAIPCEVRVAVAEARHQYPFSAVKDTYVWVLFQFLDVWYFAHGDKSLTYS